MFGWACVGSWRICWVGALLVAAMFCLPGQALVVDWSGDGKPDIITRKSDGTVQMLRGNGAGGWITGNDEQIGGGWNHYTAIIAPGDWSGDGKPDIITRKPDGTLQMLRGNGTDGWVTGNEEQIDTGWNQFTAILAPGDWDGDGNPDLLARRGDGTLHLRSGNGQGAFANDADQIDTGWNQFTAILAPGDWDGDGNPDLLARRGDGTLHLRSGNGQGAFTNDADQIDTGWNDYTAIVTSGGTVDTPPFATVLASNGDVIARYGSDYAMRPGGQIQMAENHAMCGNMNGCPSPIGTTPVYPKVSLDSGTFTLTTQSGLGGLKCAGIWAYAGVRLQGSSGTVIDNQVDSPVCDATQLWAVLQIGRDPNDYNQPGASASIASVQVNVHHKARYGIAVLHIDSPSITIHSNIVTDPNSTGILVGADGFLPVVGRATSPALVTHNTVTGSQDDGITLGGQYIRAQYNTVSDYLNHGIVAYSNVLSKHTEILNNTISGGPNGSFVGVSLDGSDSAGVSNTVHGNTITNQCVGIAVHLQSSGVVFGNTVTNPDPTFNSCPPDPTGDKLVFGIPTGIVVADGIDNLVHSNQTWRVTQGIWVRNHDGASPTGAHGNRVGTDAGGSRLGNWINDAQTGIRVNSPRRIDETGVQWVDPPDDENDYVFYNVMSGTSVPCWYGTKPQYKGGNSHASCN